MATKKIKVKKSKEKNKEAVDKVKKSKNKENLKKENIQKKDVEKMSGQNEKLYEKKKVYKGYLIENKVCVFNKTEAEEVYDIGCFGKIKDDKNELSLEEALLLMKRNRLKVFKNEKEISREEFYKYACSVDAEFPWKYTVYEELRNRGLLVRTGFKFGTHFRVYARGVKLKRGPKTLKEHTKWVVHAVPENYTCSFPELSRAVRLAHNIRAKMLWAIVDEEGDVTYYEIIRKTP
ncbi:MAG: tRNA-intron lyase [Candidatus Aenigmarchaeota archaeon]|nr:tRNA-intron lyase [Candidatus Aenigmarchaeota archaeon]